MTDAEIKKSAADTQKAITPQDKADELRKLWSECNQDLFWFARAIRAATLESAAKECENTDNVEADSHNSYYAQLGDASATRAACATAIRALALDDGKGVK